MELSLEREGFFLVVVGRHNLLEIVDFNQEPSFGICFSFLEIWTGAEIGAVYILLGPSNYAHFCLDYPLP